jgi:hypothetical protein
MAPAAIPVVKERLRGVTLPEARAMARRCEMRDERVSASGSEHDGPQRASTS